MENSELKNLIIIPKSTLERYKLYQRILSCEKREYISSEEIGKSLYISPDQVRKDLTYLKNRGIPKKGYFVKTLLRELNELFGITRTMKVILVGAGHLGQALINYPGFKKYKIEIVAVFDNDPNKIDTFVGDLAVLPLEDMPRIIRRFQVKVGIICVPDTEAQKVANLLIANKIKAIWNFAPVNLSVPPNIILRNEDITGGLLTLKHILTKRQLEK